MDLRANRSYIKFTEKLNVIIKFEILHKYSHPFKFNSKSKLMRCKCQTFVYLKITIVKKKQYNFTAIGLMNEKASGRNS